MFRSLWDCSGRLTFFVFCTSLIYAVIRYNVFGLVPYEDIPLYISNKAFALSAVILLLINTIRTDSDRGILNRHIRMFMIMHAIISFFVFTPAYFREYFHNGKILLQPAMMLLAGIYSFFSFNTMHQVKEATDIVQSRLFMQRIKIFTLIALSVHIFLRGISSWLNPEIWPAGIVPVSLIAFIALLIVALMPNKKGVVE